MIPADRICIACDNPVPAEDRVLLSDAVQELPQPVFVMDFHCAMIALHLHELDPDLKVVVSFDLLRRIRDREVEGS